MTPRAFAVPCQTEPPPSRSGWGASEVRNGRIGLFVCARLFRAMGGRIWARPRETSGAESGFSLQVMQAD
jgi:signal transduction histidine kinase